MIFNHNSLGNEITRRHLLEIEDAERQARHNYYTRRYNMLKGIVTDPHEPGYDRALCQSFFPAGQAETGAEYDERMKVWVPAGVTLLNRLVDMSLKGSVEHSFEAFDEEDAEAVAMAEIATDAYNLTLEYNNWELTGRERLIEALAIGQVSDWFDYRKHDPQTGREFDYGGRVKLVKQWPWFAEPVVAPDNVTEIIGAALIYNQANASITNAISLTMDLSGERVLKTKLWLDPKFNTDNGEKIHSGTFVCFDNETVSMPEGMEDWNGNNRYGITPVVFWQAVDIDESQYNGESYFDRFVDAWIKLSRAASNELSAIQYIINQKYVIAHEEATPKQLYARHNIVDRLPAGEPQAQIGIMERMLDLEPEAAVKGYLASVIGEAGGFSAELSTLDGVGKIADSGIALKIVYEKTVDAVRTIRKMYKKSKREMMYKTLKVILYHNGGKINGKVIDLGRIAPRVGFDDNIMPTSEVEALKLNIMRRNEGIISEEEFVILENENIKTREEAEIHLAKIKEARAQNQPQQRTFIRRDARQNRGNQETGERVPDNGANR